MRFVLPRTPYFYILNLNSSGLRSILVLSFLHGHTFVWPPTEMSTRNLPGGKGQPARKADNLTAICEPII
jgi:hypothetical protein